MKIEAASRPARSSSAELLVVPVFRRTKKKPKKTDPFGSFSPSSRRSLELLDDLFEGALSRAVVQRSFTAPKGGSITVPAVDSRTAGGIREVRLVGMSSEAEGFEGWGADEWRKLGGEAWQFSSGRKFRAMAVSLEQVRSENGAAVLTSIVEGIMLARYRFTRYKGSKKSKSEGSAPALATLHFTKSALPKKRLIKEAAIVCDSVNLARDLVNTPASDLTPKHLVQQARRIAGSGKGPFRLRAHSKAALKRMGANALLAVSRGSVTDPYLIHLTYRPTKKSRSTKRVVVVGKGVTFDSGGLSMKSPGGMISMKYDMAGAAAVLGLMQAIKALPASQRPKHEVHALIPTSENMVSGSSVKPGDVVQAMNGKTIEIINTDAEGRLLLADALSYSARIKPDIVIDLATLTGSCVAALGEEYAGLFCSEPELGAALEDCARAAGERVWQLPLAEIYRPLLDSPIADMKNSAGTHPGAVLAALFLKEFLPEGAQWAHFDIAGPVSLRRSEGHRKKGGTGCGVRLVLRFLQQL